MIDQTENRGEPGEESLFSRRRVKTLVGGALLAFVAGLLILSFYLYFQYGVNPVQIIFGGKESGSPDEGKLAYDKNTKFFLGVIKGEGASPRRGKVYYIERAGGQMMEMAKDRVEVREPGQ